MNPFSCNHPPVHFVRRYDASGKSMEVVNLEVFKRVDYKIGFAVDGFGGHRAKIHCRKQLPFSIVGAAMAVPVSRLIRRKNE